MTCSRWVFVLPSMLMILLATPSRADEIPTTVLGRILRGDPQFADGWDAAEELLGDEALVDEDETLSDEDDAPEGEALASEALPDESAPLLSLTSPANVGGVRRADGGPHGSVSLGFPAQGSLKNARELPLSGAGYAFFPHVGARRTNFGTDEVFKVLERVGGQVAAQFPGSVVRVGNVSYRQGGKIPWSVSHRAGRDFDAAFFVDDPAGRPAAVHQFEHFDRRGLSRAHPSRRFSAARNWAFVEALVLDDEYPVQRIFVADWLRDVMVAHARENGAPEEAIRRAMKVLMQPTLSTPHADHFHVRLYCTLDDRLEGCHDYDPLWEWVPDPTPFVEVRVSALIGDLEAPDAALRRDAIALLGRLRAARAIPRVARRLDDEDVTVRETALRFLTAMDEGAALRAIVQALPRTRDAAWAETLMGGLANDYTGLRARILERILGDPGAALPHLASATASHTSLRVAAARTLRSAGRPQSVKPLIDALLDEAPEVRVAAAAALPHITNHDFGGRWGKGVSRQQAENQQKRWVRWLNGHRHNSWEQWIRLGFRARGIQFRGKMMSKPAVPTLIRALDRGGYLQHNALRILQSLLGERPTIRCGTGTSCWVQWWRRAFRDHGLKSPGI